VNFTKRGCFAGRKKYSGKDRMEKAILVGVGIENHSDTQRAVEELKALAFACDMEVAAVVLQNMQTINKAFYIGTGKVGEVRNLAEMLDADIIVFDDALSPIQLRNLQKEIGKPILDRTTLILEIFSKRAGTREAKLQVEVARLQYTLPRLVGLHDALSRQGGGSGVSNKGAGEKKLELDRRRIEHRISELQKELKEVSRERETQSKQRNASGILKVALVGYTNAGKSTMMNRMIEHCEMAEEKKVFERDMLFATLETTVRKIRADKNFTFLLSDTVGFISKLPHHLVKAFRSTLEEVRHADLLLLVMDYSDPYHREQLEVTRETLEELGAAHIPAIYVYNKADLCDVQIPRVTGSNIYMSAKAGVGIDELLGMIRHQAEREYVTCRMSIPFPRGDVFSYLKEQASILDTEYTAEGIQITCKCKKADFDKYGEYVTNPDISEDL